MADRYLLESGAPDGYQLEDGSGVLLLDVPDPLPIGESSNELPVRRKQAGRLDVIQGLLLTTLAVVASAVVERGPLITPIPKARAAQQVAPTPNLLVGTLASGAAAPFVPVVFDNPIKRQIARTLDDVPNLIGTTLAATAPPFVPIDFPNPRGRIAPRIADSVGPLPSSIYAQPTFGPKDWPNPRGRAQPQHDQVPNLLTDTLAPTVAPLRPTLFENPTVRKRVLAVTHHRASYDVVPVSTVIPFTQSDWPNPKVVRRVLTVTYHRSAYDANPTPTPMPVARQQDWQNPRGKNWLKGQEFERAQYQASVKPFAQYDWPNPSRRKYQGPVVHFRASFDVTAATTVAPFSQSDWQNPRGARQWQRGDVSEVLPLTTLFIPPQAQPIGLQRDWPNPRGKIQWKRDAFERSLPLSTLYIPPAPLPIGLQRDFPNPTLPRPRDTKFTATGTPVPNTIPPAVATTVPPSYPGGGMGGGKAKWWDEDKPKRKRKGVFERYHEDTRQAFAEPAVIRDVYAELKKLERDVPDVAAFAAPEGGTDWTAAAQDLDTVTRILQAWRAEERLREIQDDDEEWMLF